MPQTTGKQPQSGDGAWSSEPDALDFLDDATGLPCAMRRGPMGHWCGYVGIPLDHPWHGKSYNYRQIMPKGWLSESRATIDEVGCINVLCSDLGENEQTPEISLLVRCHGGLTYSGAGDFIGNDKASWWLGFDCAHSGDLCPKSPVLRVAEVYRDVAYVKEALAKACSDIAKFGSDVERAIDHLTRSFAEDAEAGQ